MQGMALLGLAGLGAAGRGKARHGCKRIDKKKVFFLSISQSKVINFIFQGEEIKKIFIGSFLITKT